MKHIRVHYNHVTDAWKAYMGDNFHFGYFDSGETDLARATDRLIDKMLELCSVNRRSTILDVGCGVGGPALYIHGKFGCRITGISTSERGVELARASAGGRGSGDRVRFIVADAQSHNLPDRSFDIVWVMESSHLMADKEALFCECFRVLKDGGILVLCDIMLSKILPLHREIVHYLLYGGKYLQLIRTWGNARVNLPGTYCNGLREAGFREIVFFDITDETFPTLRCWRTNAVRKGEAGVEGFSAGDVRRFIRGGEILEDFFRRGIFGYGLLRAGKNRA